MFPDSSIDLTVTSPPYDNLRTYNGYEFPFEAIAQQLYRVTKDGGVVVWVVGDATLNGSETGTSFRQALYFKEIGFNLHDTMIWLKNSPSMPSLTRYNQVFEYMFILTKNKQSTFNCIEDKPNIYAGKKRGLGVSTIRQSDGRMSETKRTIVKEMGKRNNVWKMNTSNQENPCKTILHPATFPFQLAHDHIYSWSNEGDVVLDPFMGSGTTALAAIKLNRQYIGIDISQEYCDLASERIKQELQQRNIFD